MSEQVSTAAILAILIVIGIGSLIGIAAIGHDCYKELRTIWRICNDHKNHTEEGE